MSQKVVVLGAGPGGYVAAIRAAQRGAQVTLIEKENVGGTCLNHGCIPSKIMKKTADLLEDITHASDFGIDSVQAPHCNISHLLARKEKIIHSQSQGILGLLKKNRVQYITGSGFIPEPNTIQISSQNSEKMELSWDKLIIATGSRPLDFPSISFDGKHILSSNDALSYKTIPKHMIIIGGGVIGCEFAFIWKALGSQVSIIEGMDRLLPLPSVDEDCSKLLLREMKKRKIKVHLKKTLHEVNITDKGLTATIGPSPFIDNLSEKEQQTLLEETDNVVLCVGRRANSDNIGLENISVETDDRGWIIADETMCTSNKDVYAIGDILGPDKIMLAHVASTEAEIAVDNIFGTEKVMSYDTVPGAIFTSPEIGNVGLSEAEAREHYGDIRADTIQFRTNGKAQVLGELAGQIKIVSEQQSKKIVGVHIAGAHATDLLAEATLAVQMGATTKDIANTIHAHPTLSEIMLEASFKSLDIPLHG